HSGELRFGFNIGKRYGLLQRHYCFYIHHHPWITFDGCWIRIMRTNYFDDTDDLFAFIGVIEEGAIACLHRDQILLSEVIAHTTPKRSPAAGGYLLLP